MDTSRKKAGVVVIFGIVILIIGTCIVFVADNHQSNDADFNNFVINDYFADDILVNANQYPAESESLQEYANSNGMNYLKIDMTISELTVDEIEHHIDKNGLTSDDSILFELKDGGYVTISPMVTSVNED